MDETVMIDPIYYAYNDSYVDSYKITKNNLTIPATIKTLTRGCVDDGWEVLNLNVFNLESVANSAFGCAVHSNGDNYFTEEELNYIWSVAVGEYPFDCK